MHDDLAAVLDKVEAGAALDDGDRRALTGGRDLIALGMAADAARRRRHGDRTTFVHVVPVPVSTPAPDGPVAADAGELRLTGRPETAAAAVGAVRTLAERAGGVPVTGFAYGGPRRALRARRRSARRSAGSSCARRGSRGWPPSRPTRRTRQPWLPSSAAAAWPSPA